MGTKPEESVLCLLVIAASWFGTAKWPSTVCFFVGGFQQNLRWLLTQESWDLGKSLWITINKPKKPLINRPLCDISDMWYVINISWYIMVCNRSYYNRPAKTGRSTNQTCVRMKKMDGGWSRPVDFPGARWPMVTMSGTQKLIFPPGPKKLLTSSYLGDR